MGNAGSGPTPRDRQKSGEVVPSSPYKEEQAFNFDKKPEKIVFQGSQDDEEPYFTKPVSSQPPESFETPRPRSNTVSEGTKVSASNRTTYRVAHVEHVNQQSLALLHSS